MSFSFNPLLLLGLDMSGSAPGGSVSYKDPVADEASLPTVGNNDGDVRVAKSTDHIYVWNTSSSKWIDTGITLASAVGSTPNAAGVVINQVTAGNIIHQELQLEPADATHPGILTTSAQTIAGNKTLTGTTNLSALSASTPLKLDGSKNIVSSSIVLTSDVSGVLPISNGGTNSSASLSGNKAIVSNGTSIIESSVTSTELGYSSGVTSSIQTQINAKASQTYVDTIFIPLTQRAANNGVATLDSGGKIPVTQLPNTVMEYQGNWDASTNTPTLADGIGNAGDVYRVNVAGTQNLGSGPQTFAIGDWAVYNGTIWQKSINSNAVSSVNSQTGTVVLTTTDISEGTNLYFTNGRAQSAITGGASSIVTSNLTASFALQSDGSGKVAVSAVTATELGYVSGVTSAIQTQLNNKQPLDATLTSLAAYNTNGLLTQTAADTFTGRTLTAGSSKQSVSNGDGVAGNPTIDVVEANLTLNNIGGTLGISKGGTGQTTNTAAFNTLSPITTKGDLITSDGTNNIRLAAGANGSALVADSTQTAGLKYVPITVSSSGDIAETSFSGANNQAAAANVTGLAFANGTVRAFDALVSVYVNATSSLYEVFKLKGIQKGSSWNLAYESSGDVSGVIFSITNVGQVQYQSTNNAGFVALTMKFRAITVSV